MEMQDFQHITTASRLFHGPSALGQLGRELNRLKATRAVIFCGGSLEREVRLLDLVKSALGDRYAATYSAVRAHSPVSAVRDAADTLRRLNADAVIAIGGGSAIVTARAAAILLAEDAEPRALATTQDGKGGLNSPRLMAPKLPQFVIPTTPTTAAVKAGSAVFDPETGERLALFDPKTRAHAVFLDPDMLMSAPRGLVASAAINTFATAMEGLMSRQGNPLSDALLMQSVRLLGHSLSRLEQEDRPKLRGELALAAVLCGQGTDHTGAGITTVLGHAIGARHEMENGIANAIVLPHVLRFNAEASEAGVAKVAAALGLRESDSAASLAAVTETMLAIFAGLDVPSRLRDVGIPAEALPAIADVGMGDWFLKGNPRPVREASELHEVLEQAW